MAGSFCLDFTTRLERLKAIFHHSDGSQTEEYVPDVYPFIMDDTSEIHRNDCFNLMVDFIYRGLQEGREVGKFRKAAIDIACSNQV